MPSVAVPHGGRRGGGHRLGNPPRVEFVELVLQPAHRDQPSNREFPVECFLLLGEHPLLLVGQRPPEQIREDVAVAAAVEPLAIVHGQGLQAVAPAEDREGLHVNRHVVDDGAIEIEDRAAHHGDHYPMGFRRSAW